MQKMKSGLSGGVRETEKEGDDEWQWVNNGKAMFSRKKRRKEK